ncbi:hypothetical protein LCGC14_1134660 [marine sediment metagenome]|uniref:Uncharacterized protein n=1 Tax=marine sediment metagenome TaxID=412755 RepID=A0A0F9PIB0_9ZZZZ
MGDKYADSSILMPSLKSASPILQEPFSSYPSIPGGLSPQPAMSDQCLYRNTHG